MKILFALLILNVLGCTTEQWSQALAGGAAGSQAVQRKQEHHGMDQSCYDRCTEKGSGWDFCKSRCSY